MPPKPQGIYIDANAFWQTTTTNTTNAWQQIGHTNSGSSVYVAPCAPSRLRRMIAWTRMVLRRIGQAFRHVAQRLFAPPAMFTPATAPLPPMSGGAIEDEVEITREYPKKKITLDRKTGLTRDKGSGPEQGLHTGKLILVKTMEGPGHLTENVGIKTEPRNGWHVEIPIRMLREALDELEGTTK